MTKDIQILRFIKLPMLRQTETHTSRLVASTEPFCSDGPIDEFSIQSKSDGTLNPCPFGSFPSAYGLKRPF